MTAPQTVSKPSKSEPEAAAAKPSASATAGAAGAAGPSEIDAAAQRAVDAKNAREDEERLLAALVAEEAELMARKEAATKKLEAAERVNKLRAETAKAESDAFDAERRRVAPPRIMYRDPAKIEELERELAYAKRTEEEAFRASRDARADSIVAQSRANGGEVDHDQANKDAQKAADAVRRRAYQGKPRGIYVLSTLETTHPNGTQRAVLTPGTRVPDGMLDHYPPEMLQKHFDDGILEDRR